MMAEHTTLFLMVQGIEKMDPRVDRERIKTINQNHNGKVLDIIRIIKYWNKRPTKPAMDSYLFECMLLNYYESISICSDYIRLEVKDALYYIYRAVYNSVLDPKNIQGDLNNLSHYDKFKISNRALEDNNKAVEAGYEEKEGNHKVAIEKWKEVFGDNFPDYTGEE